MKVCRSSRGDHFAGDAGGFDGCGEFAADVGGVELSAVAGGEHRPGVASVAVLQVGESLGVKAGRPRAPGPCGFGVAVLAYRPPDCNGSRARGSGRRPRDDHAS